MATVSMTSIPPDFFDEERDKVFQMEIIQDSLVERIDKLIKKLLEKRPSINFNPPYPLRIPSTPFCLHKRKKRDEYG